MRKQKLFFLLLLPVFVLLLAACGSQQPQIVIETGEPDWGHVVNGEILTRDLVVRNEGVAPLQIEAVSTSCSCTTADLSPMTIDPGGSGTLHIEFDSGAHGPELTGELVRQVFVMSNDPNLPEVKIEFSVVVDPGTAEESS